MDFTLPDSAREAAALAHDLATSGRDLLKEAHDAGYGVIERTAILIELGRQAADVPIPADPLSAGAYQLGVVEKALEMTAAHARERVQFGRPIGSFQAVSQRLADAYIDVEALRVALWQAVWCSANDPPATAEIATAAFWAAEAGHRVLHTAVHVHGGTGLDLDYPLHRYFLAAEQHEFRSGGATAHLLTLGTVLT
ncbi:putative acyl-CoA dehydrogenase [Actinoplanes missouriensis 431]|uniref:Putative acyl-CoA dehydrogenase n=1 Tax=Actinoplanes missouriensis (strain ATCC 14538 / DSM 43046 / CBS 188.64 / JCM 3121 / NBRC 102363 / NCIMB 12654 / NRRL B-3342 / UNCC 431) TaxID=512565 RepID=I0H2Z7_ACTM4|nr:putative acyl-CoA dehydrogenase [Actinoplanes missouriensis 431]